MKRVLVLITFSALLFSCGEGILLPSDEKVVNQNENPLVAYWAYSDYTDDIQIFTRVSALPENSRGYAFFSDTTYQERANSGFCATPPVTYGTYEGTWSISNEDELILEGTYWGGEKTEKFEIVSVNRETLKLKYLPM